MKRRNFLRYGGMGLGAALIPLPVIGRTITGALTPIPDSDKRLLADIGLNAATAKGATYADVRIGRYLNQFVITREDKVQNIVNTESFGVGIRVIANGTWGFAATSEVTKDSIASAAEQAVAIAKANSKFQDEPVNLAPVKGHGEGARRLVVTA